jgi:hypothetical protein
VKAVPGSGQANDSTSPSLEQVFLRLDGDLVIGGTGIPSRRSGHAPPVHGHGQDGRATSKGEIKVKLHGRIGNAFFTHSFS